MGSDPEIEILLYPFSFKFSRFLYALIACSFISNSAGFLSPPQKTQERAHPGFKIIPPAVFFRLIRDWFKFLGSINPTIFFSDPPTGGTVTAIFTIWINKLGFPNLPGI